LGIDNSILYIHIFFFEQKLKLLLEKSSNHIGTWKSLPTILYIQFGVSSTQTLFMTPKITYRTMVWVASFAASLLLTCTTLHDLNWFKPFLILSTMCLNLFQLFPFALIAVTIWRVSPSMIMSLKLISLHNPTACKASKAFVTTGSAAPLLIVLRADFVLLYLII